MPDPVYKVEIEFTTGSWTDVTGDCLHITISRNSASAENGISVGRAEVLLMNNSGKYSPENTGSPYYPNLKPYKNIRITAMYNNTTYYLFTGIIDSYSVNPVRSRRRCVLQCSDKIKLLQHRKITLPLKTNINVGTLFGDVLDAAGIGATDRTIDTFYDIVPFAWYRDRRPIEVMNELMAFGYYRIYMGPDGILHVKNRYWGLEGQSVATYDTFYEFNYELGEEEIANYIKVSGRPRKKASTTAVVANLEGATSIDPGSTLTFWLNYYDPDTKEQDTPADEMVTPVAGTDYTANTAPDGTGTDKTSQISVSVTFFSASAKCDVTNNDTGTVYLTKFQLRGKSIQKQSLISYVTEDTTSQATYGQRDFAVESDYIGSIHYAKDYGDFLLAQKKDPHPKVNVSLKNVFPDVLARELGDIITITENNTGVSGKWIVRNIEHDINMSEALEHIISMNLEQWYDLQYLILDDAQRGKLGIGKLGF